MRILMLGYEENPIIDYMQSMDDVYVTSSRLTLEEIQAFNPDFIISYGYKYILRPDVVAAYRGCIINLHISKLPWNRGYHPNFWSFYENTPKGVTIHLIDEGVDTGQLLLQKEVAFAPTEDTLAKTYQRLRHEIEELFITNWAQLRQKDFRPIRQPDAAGSHHYRRELDALWAQLSEGWDTPITEVEDLGAQDR